MQASYFLTGESRVYSFPMGGFMSVSKIQHPQFGAWEVAARYDGIDLNDDDIQGGRQNDVTLGLNWFPIRELEFMLNFVNGVVNSDLVPNGHQDIHIVALRTQILI